ncbi:MAG: hypothetical protein A2Y82_04940 [Candidatus Buchananbacteria bacterium RBG_13_36_9]|uniref:AttH domain-containing protein n=1 Tax=Candidatus Buchananbacteria bacterium RBG_13_36_9 TaxID=1797530 RepID=A0A1G1XQL7_9BACT|nr:MAG: hypothetical protein A2Y82_04940 [Candidatus Buchananbacteria bacterium RBG_13_36_9]
MRKEKFKPLKFPRDEQKHDHIIEWWYFNGHLKTKNSKIFSYMNCLFAAKPKKVAIPLAKRLPFKTWYFAHYMLTDHQKHKMWSKISPVSLVDKKSFTLPLLWVQYDNSCVIEETKLFNYQIVNDFVDLNLYSKKRPLLVNNKGFIDLGEKATYYYSLSRLQTKGLIKVGNKWLEVAGLSWMDHQWAQTPFTKNDKWTWFSLQLNNGVDIICFVYGDKNKVFHATMLDKNNRQKISDNLFLKLKRTKYASPETGAVYQLGYDIYLPDWGIKLIAEPVNKKQEIIFGPLNYWEGAIKVEGECAGKKVSGQGFLEITGVPMKKSLFKIYMNKLEKEIRKRIS